MIKKNIKRIACFIPFIFCLLLLVISKIEHEGRVIKESQEKIKFENSITEHHEKLLKDFSFGLIKRGELNEFSGISGGFYALYRFEGDDFFPKPHININKQFKSKDYSISYNKDSLNFIIITEYISHVKGVYDNGGNAEQIEVQISVIDTNKDLAYTIMQQMGSEPPSKIRRKAHDRTGTMGSYMTDEEIFDYLINNIKITK